ncbi:CPBP family glutamic-type intramembrane protease [Actinomyces naeslundii]
MTRLVVFSVVVLGSGWIGLLVDDALGTAHSMKGQGSLVWIMTPLLVGAVLALSDPSLRRSYVASWLPGRLRAYGVALAIFPLSFVVAIAVGWAAGVLSPGGLGAFGSAVAVNVLPTVLKNIAEEGAWRGYLTPGLLRRRLPDPAVWLVVGVVWGAWHLPYYLWFLDESLIRSVYDVPPIIFALIAVPVTICWVPLFTELRILSGSIWPGLIAHSIANLSHTPLTLGGLPIKPGWGLLVSPMVGIIPNAIVLAAGLGLWARRTGRLRGRSR